MSFPRELPVSSHYRLWYLLGAVCSKLEQVAKTPAMPEEHARIAADYMFLGVQATCAIHGNSMRESEIREIEAKAEPQGARECEISNVLQACHALVRVSRRSAPPALDADYICRINATILNGLELEEGAQAGVPVDENAARKLGEYCAWMESETFRAAESMRMTMALLKAALAHVYLLWISPFAEGNARTARLVEYMLLLQAGVPAPAAALPGMHYSRTQEQFRSRLAELEQPGEQNFDRFLIYALQGFSEGLDTLLARQRECTLESAWTNHVHAVFRGTLIEKTAKRRRALLLSMPATPVEITKYRDLPQELYYEYYKNKSLRTLTRDLAELVDMGLLEHTESGYRARRELMQG